MKLTDAPKAGWYPDPAGTSRLRWWEGADWTDHYRARPSESELATARGAPHHPQPAEAAAPHAVAQVVVSGLPASARSDADAIIAEVRQVARSEVERAADLFSARARAATRDLQPLISQYTVKVARWFRIIAILVVVLVVAWFVFQAIAQESFFNWVGDRIDNLTD